MDKKIEESQVFFEQAHKLFRHIERDENELAIAMITTCTDLAYCRQIYTGISPVSIAILAGNKTMVDYLLKLPKAKQKYTLFDLLYYNPQIYDKELADVVDGFIKKHFSNEVVEAIYSSDDTFVSQDPINPVCYRYISGICKDLTEIPSVEELLPGLAKLDFNDAKKIELLVNCLGALIKLYDDATKNDQLKIAIQKLFELMQKSLTYKSNEQRRINNLIVSWCYRAASKLFDNVEYQFSFTLLDMAKIVNTKSPLQFQTQALKEKRRTRFVRDYLDHCNTIVKKMLDMEAYNEACIYADFAVDALEKVQGDEEEDTIRFDYFKTHAICAYIKRHLWDAAYTRLKDLFEDDTCLDQYPANCFDFLVKVFEEFEQAIMPDHSYYLDVEVWRELILVHKLRRVINLTHTTQAALVRQLKNVDYHGIGLLVEFLNARSFKLPIKREKVKSVLCDFVVDLLSRHPINGSKNTDDEFSLINFFLKASILNWNMKVQCGEYAGWSLWMLNCINMNKLNLLRMIAHECDVNAIIASGPDKGLTALHLTTRAGNVHAVDFLLKSGANPMIGNQNLLGFALQCGATRIAERLLREERVDVHDRIAGVPIILLAIEKRLLPVVIRLVLKGANPNGLDSPNARKSLHMVLLSYKQDDEKLLLYLLNNPKIDFHAIYNGESPVFISARTGIGFAVEKLLSFNADVHASVAVGPYVGHDAVSIAVDQGRQEIVDLFLKNNKVDFSKVYHLSKGKKTITEIAAKHPVMLKKLQAHWLDTNLQQVRAYVAQLVFCEDIVNLHHWLDFIASPQSLDPITGETLFHIACRNGKAASLAKMQAVFNLPNDDVMKLMSLTQHEACLRALVKDRPQAVPRLAVAFTEGNYLLVDLLLEIIYDEQKLEDELRNCLVANQIELFLIVAKQFVDLLPDSLFLLDLVVKSKNEQVINASLGLYNSGNGKKYFKMLVNTELDANKNTFMHLVCSIGEKNIIAYFVKMGGDLAKENAQAVTPLACVQNQDLRQLFTPKAKSIGSQPIDIPICKTIVTPYTFSVNFPKAEEDLSPLEALTNNVKKLFITLEKNTKETRQKKILNKLIKHYDEIYAFVVLGELSRHSPILSLIRYLREEINEESIALSELIDTAILVYQELKDDFHLDDPEHRLAISVFK